MGKRIMKYTRLFAKSESCLPINLSHTTLDTVVYILAVDLQWDAILQ